MNEDSGQEKELSDLRKIIQTLTTENESLKQRVGELERKRQEDVSSTPPDSLL